MTGSRTSYWDRSPEAIARRLAEEDEVARMMQRHLLASAFIGGKALGFAESYLATVSARLDREALGEEAYDAALVKAHRVVIDEICEILGIAVKISTLERLNGLDLPQLIEVKDTILQTGYWPHWME